MRAPGAKRLLIGPFEGLERFHSSCRVDFVVSHPFHKELERDGARSFLTPSVKML
jgi:hypothetical protein